MEDKLYYRDSYIQTFATKLTKQDIDDDGQWYVTLTETAFYPTGGGQPFDTGTLNDHTVLKVEEVDGEIRHYLDIPFSETHQIINGQIDWKRRFDHMQQHAGQHILSAAFEELFGYSTVGFHLGQEILTIDLDIEDLTDQEAAEAEKRANQIILENRPIETRWISREELAQYPLRKQPTVTKNIRLVIIPEFDYNGCGGTHPASTGQVGPIKILDWERQRKRVRIQFVCGNRVLMQLNNKQQIMLELTKLLNAPEQGMISALTRLLEQQKSSDKRLEELAKTMITYEAKELINERVTLGGKMIISKVLENRSIKELQNLARTITNDVGDVIIILVSENDTQLQIVAARGVTAKGSMKELMVKLLPSINGKGGGNESFAQGGGERTVDSTQLLDHCLRLLNEI
jgi:alanyl-tRNA synthetase